MRPQRESSPSNKLLVSYLAGSIAPSRGGYELSLKATHPVTGEVIADASRRAASKDQVLNAATQIVTKFVPHSATKRQNLLSCLR